MELAGLRIHITGIVQGVGFRPFVYSLAQRLSLTGWVRNTSAGVDIEVDGLSQSLDDFVWALQNESPPLALIDEMSFQSRAPDGYSSFEIIHSESIPDAFQPISPDVSICPDCLRELFDPNDRRYRYPFINCTNCGPRFTIIQDIPYDRPNTTMSGFPLCSDCSKEYHDPQNRRFHAQPVACPICGPRVWLESSVNIPSDVKHSVEPELSGDLSILAVQNLLLEGKIVAIKGLGGFHLACDALNEMAVGKLRSRKLRVDKPFALMMADLQTVETHCYVSAEERELLESYQRPIVILKRKPTSDVAEMVSPHQDTLGVMLPYTPLHYLLFAGIDIQESGGRHVSTTKIPSKVLVMTSGNISEEPIAYHNDEARQRLGALADAFLMHNRPIYTRCDDSVIRIFYVNGNNEGGIDASDNVHPVLHKTNHETLIPLRRARGYTPYPIHLKWESPPILATGAELKNTFCLTRGRYAFLSHHIGDMENYETWQSFEDGVKHFERLFRVNPSAIAHDLHPNYLSTRYALERSEREELPAIGIQHHHAHIAACMAENDLTGERPVIGVAFDGTGYGLDGAIWGGEFLIADYNGFDRAAHLEYIPLPGGDAAVRKPARTALAYIWHAGEDWDIELDPVKALSADERTVLRSQLEHQINSPWTSSTGRLFDAVASIAGVRHEVNYEAQAAIEMEALVAVDEIGSYPFEIIRPEIVDQHKTGSETGIVISTRSLIQSILKDVRNGASKGIIAARFHNTVARIVVEMCLLLRDSKGINEVALSGGVWQNMTLLEKTCHLLIKDGFRIILHRKVPPNDGGLALGQAAIAVRYMKN